MAAYEDFGEFGIMKLNGIRNLAFHQSIDWWWNAGCKNHCNTSVILDQFQDATGLLEETPFLQHVEKRSFSNILTSGSSHIPKGHLPPIFEEGIEQNTNVEIRYNLRATERAYKAYWQLRRDCPGCKISLTQHLHLDYGGAVPISLRRLRRLTSQQ